MFLIRTLLSQGTILCIVLLLVTLDVGFSTAKATTKPGKLLLVHQSLRFASAARFAAAFSRICCVGNIFR